MPTCSYCDFEIQEDFDYCPRCGTLFSDLKCDQHTDTDAKGICLICEKVCCSKCGLYVNYVFLCDEHSDVEVFQSMAKVYGNSDAVQVDYLISYLKNNEFHPIKFDRKSSPISIGGVDYTLFRASGDSSGHLINESKILVPFSEYIEAFQLVDDLLTNETFNTEMEEE